MPRLLAATLVCSVLAASGCGADPGGRLESRTDVGGFARDAALGAGDAGVWVLTSNRLISLDPASGRPSRWGRGRCGPCPTAS